MLCLLFTPELFQNYMILEILVMIMYCMEDVMILKNMLVQAQCTSLVYFITEM